MTRRLVISLAVLVAVLVAALAAWWFTRAPLVPAVSAQKAPLVRTLQFSARVATASRVDVGSTITGRGLIRGEPLRDVRVDLPDRVPMSAPDGSEAELTGFTTSLPAHPVLDSNGRLEFTFGAKLVVRGSRGGNYRGRIPISVDYN